MRNAALPVTLLLFLFVPLCGTKTHTIWLKSHCQILGKISSYVNI